MSCRGDLLIQVLNAAWHPDSSREREGIKALIHAHTRHFSLQENTRLQSTHMRRSTGSVWHYHASRSLVIEKFLLGIVSGFRVGNLSTVFCVSDLSHDDGADQSSRKLDSDLGHSRLFGNEPITTPLPSTLSPVSRFTSVEKKQQKRNSHWHQASFPSGPICAEYDCDCCFNLGAI